MQIQNVFRKAAYGLKMATIPVACAAVGAAFFWSDDVSVSNMSPNVFAGGVLGAAIGFGGLAVWSIYNKPMMNEPMGPEASDTKNMPQLSEP